MFRDTEWTRAGSRTVSYPEQDRGRPKQTLRKQRVSECVCVCGQRKKIVQKVANWMNE